MRHAEHCPWREKTSTSPQLEHRADNVLWNKTNNREERIIDNREETIESREYGTTLYVLLLIGRVIFIDTTCNPSRKQINLVNTNIYIKSNEPYEYQSYE